MNSVVFLIIIGIAVWILNFIFGLIQIKDFNKNYIELRRLGKVAIGRKKGMINSGTIVLIRIQDDGLILESRKMQGVTVAARVKQFKGLENMYIDSIEENDLKEFNKPLKRAILDAVKNYKKFRHEEGSKKEADLEVVV
ncbi:MULTISPECIES: transcriptional regulator GutM [Clostridium]|uniref:Transcriptional regulator GutM n=1 Tax=Clostridium aquiflavi TaxID=3073603 RepID=A0ABU1ED21_9CLOT|nr:MULTISPECIES: transcriptional regulator GutM [unclassified Clostridium]MDR5586275.1 transcriptional regulator GutM [Clostridium sp. 5N-1]NFG62367.1 transcriptional regulator [Clostridium botulinum]NFQ10270.1 transcriptional regulator [Clostridium botulinum]